MANITDNTGGGDPIQETQEAATQAEEETRVSEPRQESVDDMPERGDDSTRQLRDDAQSDPMREQTEPDVDKQAIQDYKREVERAKRSRAQSSTSDSGGSSGMNSPTRTSDPNQWSGGRQTYDDVVDAETMRNTTGGSPGDAQGTGVEDVGSPDVRRQARELENRVIQETGASDSSDVRVTRDGDRLNAELTFSGRENAAASQLGVDNTDISLRDGYVVGDTKEGQMAINKARGDTTTTTTQSTGVPRTGSGPVNLPTFKMVAQEEVAAAVSDQTGQNYSSDDVKIVENADGSFGFEVREKETFDIDWSFGLGGPEDEVENALDSSAESISRAGDNFGEYLFDENTSGESGGSFLLRAAGQNQLAEQYDEGVRDFGRGAYSGAVAIANVPGLVGGAMEVVETGYAGIDSQFDQEYQDKSTKRGEAIRDSVIGELSENPVNTAGMGVGALVGSYGIISTASRIGPRAGAAARYSIQPGEELAGVAGYRLTKGATNTKTADKLFPNQEPLIFSEEAAIRGGQKLLTKARGLEYQNAATRSKPSRLAQESVSARFKAQEMLSAEAPTRMNSDINTGVMDGLRSRAKSAEFKAAEMLRSDAPTRMNSDINTPVIDRLRVESKSAEFRAAEAKESAMDRLGGLRERTRAFSEDTRGQGQIPRQRSRLRSEMEMESELETEMGPELETPRSDLTSRSSGRRFETNLTSAMEPSVTFDGPRLRMGSEMSRGSRTDMLSEPGRSRTELDLGLDNELALDTELGRRTEMDLESELGMEFENELDMEFELGRSELEVEVEPFDLSIDNRPSRRRGRSRSASSRVVERDLINPFTGE